MSDQNPLNISGTLFATHLSSPSPPTYFGTSQFHSFPRELMSASYASGFNYHSTDQQQRASAHKSTTFSPPCCWEGGPPRPLPSSNSSAINITDCCDENELKSGCDGFGNLSASYDGKENPLVSGASADSLSPRESGGDARRPFSNISNHNKTSPLSREFSTELERQRYLERRSRNNEAAKQSRNKRREREKFLEERVKLLEEENKQLKEALASEQKKQSVGHCW